MKTKIKNISLLSVLMVFLLLSACGNTESEQDNNADDFSIENQTNEMETDSSNKESTDTSQNGKHTTSDKSKQEQDNSNGKTKENISNDISSEESKNIIDPSPGDSVNQNNEREWSDVNVDPDGWT